MTVAYTGGWVILYKKRLRLFDGLSLEESNG
jgi:hypothetical protein